MTATTRRQFAPAKVNLWLQVLGRRPSDGYHLLDSLVVFADVGDTVTYTPSAETEVCVVGPEAGAIVGENLLSVTLQHINAAVSAASSTDRAAGTVALDKHLPVAAGIGGGSADAAALLRAVRDSDTGIGLSAADWHRIAADIGADVPVCLHARPMHVTGTGERLQPARVPTNIAAVLVNPRVPVPATKTRDVFRALAARQADRDAADGGDPPAPMVFETADALLADMAARGNDLTAAATSVVPEIEEVLGAIAQTPRCRLAQLSGAGPTGFGVFDTLHDAHHAADILRAAHPTWWVQPCQLNPSITS